MYQMSSAQILITVQMQLVCSSLFVIYFILFLLTDFIITDQSIEMICCLMIVLVFFSIEQGGLVLGLGVSCLVAILAVSPGYFQFWEFAIVVVIDNRDGIII